MKRKRRLSIAAVIVVVLPAMVFAAWRSLFPLHRNPPQVIGIDRASSGQFSRRIVYEESYRVTGWLPGPEGGRQTRINYRHFFLETPNDRQALAFLAGVLPDSVNMADLCQPVQNSPLWVAAGFFIPGSQINVVVFDPSGVRTQRTLAVSSDLEVQRPLFLVRERKRNAPLSVRECGEFVRRFKRQDHAVALK